MGLVLARVLARVLAVMAMRLVVVEPHLVLVLVRALAVGTAELAMQLVVAMVPHLVLVPVQEQELVLVATPLLGLETGPVLVRQRATMATRACPLQEVLVLLLGREVQGKFCCRQ
jgi:hypothetical protein